MRTAFCGPVKKGSLTVEAAIALPLFLMGTICLISMINVYGTAVEKAAALRNTAAAAAVAADAGDGEYAVDLNIPFSFTPYFLPDGIASVTIPCRAYIRTWNGRDENSQSEGSTSDISYVYVTPNKSVYHTYADCTHLELSIKNVSSTALDGMKNDYGESYQPCEKCAKNGAAALVYVTSYGDCYHNSSECQGLTRSITMVDSSEVNGLDECSRCAARDAAKT